MFAVEMESSDISKETDHFRGILESFAHDNPRGEEGVLDETGPPLLSILDTMILTSIIEENQSHVLVAFCEKGVLIGNVSLWQAAYSLCILNFQEFGHFVVQHSNYKAGNSRGSKHSWLSSQFISWLLLALQVNVVNNNRE